MSEFKYACPVCGQHIKCDSSQSGTVMECPTCFQKITVPQAPAAGSSKFIITGTKVGDRPVPTASGDSRPATAPEKHFPLAVFTVIVLLCAGAAAAFVFHGGIFKSVPIGTNTITNASASAASSNLAPTNASAKVFGYRIDSGEVVFVFEPAEFGVQVATNVAVYVAGDFNQWLGASDGRIHNPLPAWQMHRVADDRYELHMKLADFQQRPQWEFKFVVNLNQWIDVPGTALNRTTGEPVNLTLTIPEKSGEPGN